MVNSNLDLEEIFVRGVTSGERLKNFYCPVYKFISQREMAEQIRMSMQYLSVYCMLNIVHPETFRTERAN